MEIHHSQTRSTAEDFSYTGARNQHSWAFIASIWEGVTVLIVASF